MMVSNLNELKKKIFYDMLDLVGRVFILARYSSDVIIGNRGFLPEEKEKGIVLVFNRRMNFDWSPSGISAKLVFGSATHECFIPQDAIISVFSPELSAQFSVSPGPIPPVKEEVQPKKRASLRPAKPAKASNDKVVRVDFKKKK
jgi:hypothetical protein